MPSSKETHLITTLNSHGLVHRMLDDDDSDDISWNLLFWLWSQFMIDNHQLV